LSTLAYPLLEHVPAAMAQGRQVAADIHEILTGTRIDADDLSDAQVDRYLELHRGTEQALRDLIAWALGERDEGVERD